MSRAGKFIPGGARKTIELNNVPGDGRTAPIRAPEPGSGGPEKSNGGKKTPRGIGLIKPVSKGQRMPIAVMSAVVSCLLLAAAFYFLLYRPQEAKVEAAELRAKQTADQLTATQQDEQKKLDEIRRQQQSQKATLSVDSNPSNANVTIGGEHLQTPATVTDLTPGPVTVLIQAPGYEDYSQTVTVTADKPLAMGTITLTAKAGRLSLTSPQDSVIYTLTGPNGYNHSGQVPDNLSNLAPGDYHLLASQGDWKLPPMALTIHDTENVQQEIRFPFANATIMSTPPGATVRTGRKILGQTPLSLTQQRPGKLDISVDLAPYTTQHFEMDLPEFGNVTKSVTLRQDRDFIAACGLPMVWIPDGFWAGKYLMPQSEFEAVAGYNPSSFRRSNLPVDSITWEDAVAFCQKLTQYERKEGKLPEGYHYALPTETQWSELCADANIDLAAMSRTETALVSTQEVGYSEPNKYGIFDALGNVWEWCSDTDPQGNHSLRGGSWLSSPDNFPNADTRNTAAPKYTDRFTGFRVVLLPD
ncbi:MAG TPA: PEGA domain-containing protein [Candidatus Methylacidiphilales bacterium]|nr:PEGA domain-containing protein [Candidatus Methylacidiphilales bacterium]